MRVLDVLAGLLAAGVLAVGIVLMLAEIAAPAVLAAAGLGPAQGPGPVTVVAHLSVGIIGEIVVRVRGRWPAVVRAIVDCVIIAAAVTVLAVTWW
jgi:hypothetical protein